MVVACLSLFIALSGVTYAATGGNFILGMNNSAGATTRLSSGVTTGPTLNLVNTGNQTAARFTANPGKSPFVVSNSQKITNLNADKVDGKDAAELIGPRAYAYVGYPCEGSPIEFCTIRRGKGVAYAAHIGLGHYCLGVNGVDASDPSVIAVVTNGPDDTFADRAAGWFPNLYGCVPSEFHIHTTFENNGSNFPYDAQFIILIP
jgi:hypothetical protein